MLKWCFSIFLTIFPMANKFCSASMLTAENDSHSTERNNQLVAQATLNTLFLLKKLFGLRSALYFLFWLIHSDWQNKNHFIISPFLASVAMATNRPLLPRKTKAEQIPKVKWTVQFLSCFDRWWQCDDTLSASFLKGSASAVSMETNGVGKNNRKKWCTI